MRECRITDLSLGGCFIDAYASEPVGARVTLSIKLHGQVFRVPAEVVYADRVQGFAVKFLDDVVAGQPGAGRRHRRDGHLASGCQRRRP